MDGWDARNATVAVSHCIFFGLRERVTQGLNAFGEISFPDKIPTGEGEADGGQPRRRGRLSPRRGPRFIASIAPLPRQYPLPPLLYNKIIAGDFSKVVDKEPSTGRHTTLSVKRVRRPLSPLNFGETDNLLPEVT